MNQGSQTDPCYDVIQHMNNELSEEQDKSYQLQKKIKEYELELARSYWIDILYQYILPIYYIDQGISYNFNQFKNTAIQCYKINHNMVINKSQCLNLILDIKETRYLSDTIGRRQRHDIDYELMGKDLLSEVLDNKYKRELWQ
jgi:hypothetical protein